MGQGGLLINEPDISRILETLPAVGATWPWPA